MRTEKRPPTVDVEIVSSKIAVPPVSAVYILNLNVYVASATVVPDGYVASLPWYDRTLEKLEVAACVTLKESKSVRVITNIK